MEWNSNWDVNHVNQYWPKIVLQEVKVYLNKCPEKKYSRKMNKLLNPLG